MSVVRTVHGDIPAGAMGITFAHEHLALHGPLIEALFPHILLDDVSIAVSEVERCYSAGVRTMVDAMPSGGRDVTALAAIGSATGMHIIAATGLHHERYYGTGHWTSQVGADELARLFIADIEQGVDAFDHTGPVVRRTAHRAGIIKVASSGGILHPRAARLFEAAAIAHVATGAPILTHCEHGTGALEQVAAFEALGVTASALLLSHTDKVDDLEYHLAIAQTGAWLAYDQPIRHADAADAAHSTTARLMVALCESGFEERMLIGTDGARRDLWTAYGGRPGLAWLATELPAVLDEAGAPSTLSESIFVTNPQRALALRA